MKRKDQLLWLGAGAGLMFIVAFVAFAPTVLAQSNSDTSDEYLQTLSDVFRFIENNYVEEVEAKKLFEGALEGIFDALDDPYSYYLDDSAMENLGDVTTGNFGGVGLIITKPAPRGDEDEEDGAQTDEEKYVEVVSPIEGTPAYKAGLSAGDFITKIEGKSTRPYTIDEVVDRLRGEPGTEVQVTIKRGKSSFDVSIKRDIIEVPTIKHAMIGDDIGYLKIIQFTPFTDNRIEESLKDFDSKGYKSLIIDLRNNPGGLFRSVIDIADLFLSEEVIVSTRSRIPEENEVYTADPGVKISGSTPIAVLINKGSASASEILAGALRDNDRAVLIGEQSYGKGSVQEVRNFGAGGFKLTTSRYYTPAGRNIEEIGIAPDLSVKPPELSDAEEEDLQTLNEGTRIRKFVEEHNNPSEQQINDFIQTLESEGIELEERLIRKLIRDEVNRTNNNPPVYDLEYDTVLQEAVRVLNESMLR